MSRRPGRNSSSTNIENEPEVQLIGSKRKINRNNLPDDDDNDDEDENQIDSPNVYSELDVYVGFLKVDFECTEKEEKNFNALSKDAREQCFKAISRLFLFKGTRNEVVNRSTISEVLVKIDPTYKNHIKAILCQVQKFLSSNLGYEIVNAPNIIGLNESRKEDYYLSSSLTSNKLRDVVLSVNKNRAYMGFMFKVFQSIFMSPGRKIESKELLKELRKVDNNFPETISSKKTGTVTVIKELGDDYLGLMKRMTKEHYLVSKKEKETDDDNLANVKFSLGPRFFLELGKTQLVKGHYLTIGESIDEHRIEELQREDAEEEEEEEEG